MSKTKSDSLLKKEVGIRFRQFRESIKKAQHELASELDIYQSTLTNIERGKTFPNLRYLKYFNDKYKLNINWLLVGTGQMTQKEPPSSRCSGDIFYLMDHRSLYDQYVELIELMEIPVFEQVIFAKFVEMKAILKDEINTFYENQKSDNTTTEIKPDKGEKSNSATI